MIFGQPMAFHQNQKVPHSRKDDRPREMHSIADRHRSPSNSGKDKSSTSVPQQHKTTLASAKKNDPRHEF
jgi:hypothetical protein